MLAFEIGYRAIPGVRPQIIQKWSEFKQVLKQLKTPEAHAMYETVIVDTADIAYSLCVKYICAQYGVDTLSDIPYGKGYDLVMREYDEAMRSISMMDYGLIQISHSQTRTFKDVDGNEYDQIMPTLDKRGMLVVNRMSDCIVYIDQTFDEEGKSYSRGYVRGTPRYVAGSRYRFMASDFPFDYEHLVDAIHDAIDAEEKASGKGSVANEVDNPYTEKSVLDFDALLHEFNTLVAKKQKEVDTEEFASKYAPKIVEITNKYLGKGRRVADITSDQAEQLSLIVDDLKDLMAK